MEMSQYGFRVDFMRETRFPIPCRWAIATNKRGGIWSAPVPAPFLEKRFKLYAFASDFNFSRCSFKIALRLNLILLPSSASTFTRI